MKIFVKAKPLAKEEKVEKIDDNHFIVWVKEPPFKGLANKAIIKVLSDYFLTRSDNIRMISGFASRNKLLEIKGINPVN